MDNLINDESAGCYEYVVFNIDTHFRIATAHDQPIWLIQCNNCIDPGQPDWRTYLASCALSDLFMKIQSDQFLGDPVKEKVEELELSLQTTS